ncbi:MAG: hypothetical protein GY909_08010 [Oligoflexia bacterium]|nr:hypothetical protein [Oligoflexia bacterium]
MLTDNRPQTQPLEEQDIWAPIREFRKQGPLNEFDLMVQASLRYHIQKHIIDNMNALMTQGLTESKLKDITEEFDLGPGPIKRFHLVSIMHVVPEFESLFDLENFINSSYGNNNTQSYVESLIVLDKKTMVDLIKRHIEKNPSHPEEWKYSIHFQNCWNICLEEMEKKSSILTSAKSWFSSMFKKSA